MKLKEIFNELNSDQDWAIYINSIEDWEILSKFLKSKGYKFESGYTFSKYDLENFNPFKSDRYIDKATTDYGYEYAKSEKGYLDMMSYQGYDDFVLLSRPKKKLNLVQSNTFMKRKDSTYKRYKYFDNILSLIQYLK